MYVVCSKSLSLLEGNARTQNMCSSLVFFLFTNQFIKSSGLLLVRSPPTWRESRPIQQLWRKKGKQTICWWRKVLQTSFIISNIQQFVITVFQQSQLVQDFVHQTVHAKSLTLPTAESKRHPVPRTNPHLGECIPELVIQSVKKKNVAKEAQTGSWQMEATALLHLFATKHFWSPWFQQNTLHMDRVYKVTTLHMGNGWVTL